ncbi:MAG: hypothetical protein M3Y22_05770 [Pseudomonadota bacterium]|nr:hypothetical protein [Pseudomonadota bacterium]
MACLRAFEHEPVKLGLQSLAAPITAWSVAGERVDAQRAARKLDGVGLARWDGFGDDERHDGRTAKRT